MFRALVLTICAAHGASAYAQTWTPVTTQWFSPQNWTPQVVPNSGSAVAIFPSHGEANPKTVTLQGGAATVHRLQLLGPGSKGYSIGAGTLIFIGEYPGIHVQTANDGLLPDLVAVTLSFPWKFFGFIDTEGFGATLGVTGPIQSGGVLDKLGWGRVSTFGSVTVQSGMRILEGGWEMRQAASSVPIMLLGSSGAIGRLSVLDGASLTTSTISVGADVGSDASGILEISGAGSMMTVSSLVRIGDQGTALVSIVDGGRMEVMPPPPGGINGVGIGLLPPAFVAASISGEGSALESGQPIELGWLSPALLTVAEGGLLRIDGGGKLTMGREPTGSGQLNVGGAWPSEPQAAGVIDVAEIAGGLGESLVLFHHTGDINGDPLHFTPVLTGGVAVEHRGPGVTVLTQPITGAGGIDLFAGTLRATSSLGGVPGATLTVHASGTLAGTGVIDMPSTILGGGRVKPREGDGAGLASTLSFTAPAQLGSGAEMSFTIDGAPEAGLFDQIQFVDVELAGLVRVRRTPGFLPEEGAIYPLLTVSGRRTGAIAQLNLSEAPLGGGLSWDTSWLNVDGTLRVRFCEGDVTGDSFVDLADVLAVLSAWGACNGGAECPADLNGDGMVDLADLLVVLSNWGPCR